MPCHVEVVPGAFHGFDLLVPKAKVSQAFSPVSAPAFGRRWQRRAEGVPFSVTDEQRALRSTVADLMAKRSPESAVRALMATDTGFDPAMWQEMAAMGLVGLLIGEQYGGAGAGPVELGIVAEEMGAALLVGPYLSTAVLVPSLLAGFPTPQNPRRCCRGSRPVS